MIKININQNLNILTNKDEIMIINLLNKNPYNCYAEITTEELNDIVKKIKISITHIESVIRSIRANYIKNKMIRRHKFIKIFSNKILQTYNKNINILDISSRFDISPLNLLRFIFKKKYNKKLKFLINDKNINKYDKNQLDLAIKNDTYSLIDEHNIQKESELFENQVEQFLIKNNIDYKTQSQLSEEQIKLYGHPINTPDFLIISNLYLNDFKVNWIDAKNFFGSNISFVKDKITKQVKKYIDEYGDGCIVFKYGFNEELNFNNVLILSYASIR
jgi:hypothetical protein